MHHATRRPLPDPGSRQVTFRRPAASLLLGVALATGAGAAGGAVVTAASDWRIGPPVLIGEVDRDLVAAISRNGEGPFDGRDRELVVVPLRLAFQAIERMATDLREPLIADMARDGLDVLIDLRPSDTDPVIAARVELQRLREAVLGLETDVDAVVAATDGAATVRLARATASDARLRAGQLRVLVARFADQVSVRGGQGGSRPAAAAPFELIELLLGGIESALERRAESIQQATDAAWRFEVRALLGVAPAP